MAKESRWRTEARERIAIELERLSESRPGFTVKQAKEHLSAAFPWGDRKTWPGEMWRQESKAAVDRVAFSRPDMGVLCNPGGVECHNCAGLKLPRCTLCVRHRAWLAALATDRVVEWFSLLAAAARDEAAKAALEDWVAENGAGLFGLAGERVAERVSSTREGG